MAKTIELSNDAVTVERMKGGFNRVLVVRGKQADKTFVIPSGYAEQEGLKLEAESCEREAASLTDRVNALRERGRFARMAIKAIEEGA